MNRRAWALIILLALWSSVLHAQSFKEIYRLDTNTYDALGGWTVRDIVAFDSGKIAFAGAVSGPDTSGWYHQSAYVMQVDEQGQMIRYDEYEDNSQFIFQGPVVFGLCHDGQGSFYMALGSNSRQVIMKSSETGNFEWATAQNHHEFYDIHCGDTVVTFLGQDESVQGLHDFSVSQFNANGEGGFGYMYGTPDFESAERLVPLNGGGFLLVGTSSVNGVFKPMMVRVDASLQMVWGKIYEDVSGGRRVFGKSVHVAPDNSIWLAGTKQGALAGESDSLAMMRFDSSGVFQWAKLYGHPDWTSAFLVDMESSPAGDLFLAANVIDTGYQHPVVVKIAPDGQFIDARSFDDNDPATEETLGGIVMQNDVIFGAGERITVLPNFQVVREIFMLRLHDTLSSGCDQPIQLGTLSFQLVEGGNILSQPYQVADSFPIRTYGGVVLQERACYIPVGIQDPISETPVLRFQNPVAGDMRVWHDFPMGGATLEILDLNGSVLLQKQITESAGELWVDMDGFAKGLYLIRARGGDWISSTEKFLLLSE